MHPTRIDIPQPQRAMIGANLQLRLADLLDLQLRFKHAHWNVKGPNFIALHELFDDLADGLDEPIDDLAERIATLGGIANGLAPDISAFSQLPPFEFASQGDQCVAGLANSVATAAFNMRKAIAELEDLTDAGSADLCTGISRTLDKQLWFLESHL